MAYKSAISFGLVNIPVLLEPAIKNNDLNFHLLNAKTKTRIKYKKIDEETKKKINQNDIVKGYEYEPGEYILMETQDFEKIKSNQDKTIEIISFVDLKEIDPIYFEKSYYLKTNIKNKAFTLFKDALNKAKKVAIAKTVLGAKTYYAILRFSQNNIIMNTLYYEEELKDNENLAEVEYSAKELDMALRLIKSMNGKFEPKKYHDEYQDKVRDFIDKKIKGENIKTIKRIKPKSITNLIQALESSIEESSKKKYGSV